MVGQRLRHSHPLRALALVPPALFSHLAKLLLGLCVSLSHLQMGEGVIVGNPCVLILRARADQKLPLQVLVGLALKTHWVLGEVAQSLWNPVRTDWSAEGMGHPGSKWTYLSWSLRDAKASA